MLRTVLAAIVFLSFAVTTQAAGLPDANKWQPKWLYFKDGYEGREDARRVATWLDKEMLSSGWIQLDNEALFGWKATNNNKWTATRGGGLTCKTGELGWLMTTTQWADFELVVDYRCVDPDANSGVFIRSAAVPTNPAEDCYEVNIAAQPHNFPTGSIADRKRGDYAEGELDKLEAASDKFHRLHIIANGPHIEVLLDGRALTNFRDTSDNPLLTGHIGLQFNQGEVIFRRVLLKPLGEVPLFNGRDLAGWKTDQAQSAEISVTDNGEMQILGGKGQAESEGEYGDFVMQYECKVNGDGANSGVFFRSIPGDMMNGYECQIQNTYLDGNRAKPKDCGTGGIYRRVNARMVNAQDHEWFYTTLNANGPHIAAWVNGLQVTDWTDTREPDENPRKGLRTAPGTFCLQAHDPTTNLLFRNMRIAEQP
ncbi:3-keto-disaccharide hydrolase [Aeoliella sp.]|uniref:3-keto-disaccharide hydrolase n=1 Tax=Aeoliella sp. TaxID=2795800 RepID=UPI003CCC2DDB